MAHEGGGGGGGLGKSEKIKVWGYDEIMIFLTFLGVISINFGRF